MSGMKSDLSRKAEDYLEAVYVVNQEKGHVRIRDICKELGIKPPTVVEMVKKLSEQGYLVHKKNEGVYLTPKGRKSAGPSGPTQHDIRLPYFHWCIQEIANEDAVIEHELNPKTIKQIKSLVSFIEST
jgi:DtxR family Mn-dependent transcriptional regulator